MRLQEGILLDRNVVRIGVAGIGHSAGAGFIAHQLDHMLNGRERKKYFVSSPERFRIVTEPEDPEDEDLMIGVIDPLPSALMEGAVRVDELMGLRVSVIWIVNRDNPGVNRRSMERYLGFRPEFSQEEVSREMICRAEYNCMELSDIIRLEGLEKLADHIRINFSGYDLKDKLYGNFVF